jgi:hypothetical protein
VQSDYFGQFASNVTLVPFGSQHLRVSWFPYLGKPNPTRDNFSENFDPTWVERWTVFGGNWSARNGTLSTVPASANGAKALEMASDFSNFTYEADVSVGPVGNAGLILRVSKPDIGADAYCGYYVGINSQNSGLEFGCASNSWREITNVPMTFAANTFYHLKVQTLGPRIRIFVNDTNEPVLDLNDNTFSSGMIGVRDFCTDGNQSLSSFSNLVVNEFVTSPGESPLAWYPMEGDARDASGDGNDGAISGSVTFPAGKLGAKASQFDGNGDNYITIPPLVNNNFTIAFWLKTTAIGGNGQWFNGIGLVDGEVSGIANDFGIALVGNKAAFGVGNPDTTIVTTSAINDGSWHHITATRDANSGAMRLYLDGVLQASATGPTGIKNAPQNLRIGALQTLVGGSFLTGAIDDVQIFNRVFGSDEVASLMNHTPGLTPIFDTSILAGRTLLITNTATDADLPAQSLAFGIQDAPAGVAINSNTGVLMWRPAMSESGATHSITVRVSDNGAPTMSATQRFAVAVERPEKPVISMLAFNESGFSLNITGDSGPDYIVESSTNLGNAADWIPLTTNYSAAPPFLWKDIQSASLSRRFYRVRLGP